MLQKYWAKYENNLVKIKLDFLHILPKSKIFCSLTRFDKGGGFCV